MFIDKINQILPQTQCEKCDYPGCLPYATAIVKQGVAINRCQPGGQEVIDQIATLTLQPALAPHHKEPAVAQVAIIHEDHCIGCMLCIKACPVDAIIGASKQLHTVLSEACTGCGLCLPPCPTACIEFVPLEKQFPSPLQTPQKKHVYQSRHEAKQRREEQKNQRKLQNHFTLTNLDVVHKKLADILKK